MIRVLIIRLYHAVTLIYRVVLQHQLQVLRQIPLSVNRFLLLIHLILYPLSFWQVSFPCFHNLDQPSHGDADSTDLESNEGDVQIIAETPNGDGSYLLMN